MLLEGRQLDRYHILHLLGSGGTGDVYVAEDQHIGQTVAIKVIRVEEGMQTEEVQRATQLFLREAKTIVTLDHPNILALFNYGMQQIDGRLIIYLVMPYRREGSLAQWLKKRSQSGPLSWADVAFFVQQASSALQHAHDRGVIHQDIKPSNFLLRIDESSPNRPQLLLADFGAARLSTMTANISMGVRGTPAYMAPEQWNGKPVFASDQYGLAVMAYELLTWHYPFQGQMAEMMFHHFNDAPPLPSHFVPTLSAEVDEVLLHALAKQPQQRFASVSAFARAFQQTGPLPEADALSVTLQRGTGEQPRVASAFASSNGAMPAQAPSSQDLTRRPDNWQSISTSEAASGAAPPPPTPYLPDDIVRPRTPSPTPVFYPAAASSAPSTPSLPPIGSNVVGNPTPIPAIPPTPSQPPFMPPMGSNMAGNFAQASSPMPVMPPVVPPPSSSNKLRLVLLLGIVLVLVATSLFGAVSYINKVHVDATQTAIEDAASTAHAGTASVETQQTAAVRNTAAANAASTASAATVIAATATAFEAPTATTIAQHPYPAYLPGHGTLALFDPLQQQGAWSNGSNSNAGGSCQFSNGAYHIQVTQANVNYFCFSAFTYSNFAVEVSMTIAQGDCGGIDFRDNGTGGNAYLFEVCQDRTYGLLKYTDNTNSSILPTVSPDNAAIKPGLNQTNLLSLVANGSKITLFVNSTPIAEIQDSAYSRGYIGLVGETNSSPADVAYQNITIWTL